MEENEQDNRIVKTPKSVRESNENTFITNENFLSQDNPKHNANLSGLTPEVKDSQVNDIEQEQIKELKDKEKPSIISEIYYDNSNNKINPIDNTELNNSFEHFARNTHTKLRIDDDKEFNSSNKKSIRNNPVAIANPTLNIQNENENTREIKENNLKDNPSMSNLCRICYEQENEEKGNLINPCHCTGSCNFIHESCLKKWIENNVSNNKTKAQCEICKHPFKMKFYMRYKFSKLKFWYKIKYLAALLIVSSVVLTLLFTVIFVVVSSLTYLNSKARTSLVQILLSIAAAILLVIMIYGCRDCKRSISDQHLTEWRIFNIDSEEVKEQVKEYQEEDPVIIHRYLNGQNSVSNNEAEDQGYQIRYELYPYIQNSNQVVMLDN